jgi:hypothetical protein
MGQRCESSGQSARVMSDDTSSGRPRRVRTALYRSVSAPYGRSSGSASRRQKEAEVGEQYQDQGLMFATASGSTIQAENLPHRSFGQLLSGTGLPAIRLYDLRHSCATLLMASGEHPKVGRNGSVTAASSSRCTRLLMLCRACRSAHGKARSDAGPRPTSTAKA